ncbi:MAG: TonB-dependent receptor, partial [Elusimicrobia bacterium]
MRAFRRSLAVLLAVSQVSGPAAAADDAFELFEEESRVVTASRRSEAVREAPVAVEVITAEEIRRSGAVNLWDYMRFRAGMNVVDGRSGEGNRALVSIRGFPAEFVDNMLVLLDGRSVYTGLSGGAVWEALPVQAQDIERIEIIRGPNAALYGSNAGLGVINIITRAPSGRRSVASEALIGNEGLHREQGSFEDARKAGAYLLSIAHKTQGAYPTTAGAAGSDALHSNKGNFRGLWNISERSTLELFTGGAWDNLGVIDSDNPSARFRHHFEMLKHSYDPGPDSSIQT